MPPFFHGMSLESRESMGEPLDLTDMESQAEEFSIALRSVQEGMEICELIRVEAELTYST